MPSQSGIRLPSRALSKAVAELNQKRDTQDRIVLVVDGVHGLGCVDETVAEMGADYFCAGTHKWIHGPRGTGLVWARADAWARLRPLIPSFSDLEQYEAWTENRPERTPTSARRMTPGGFQAYEHQWATVAAFKMAQSTGRGRVAARVTELNSRIEDGLAAMKGLTLHTRGPGPLRRHLLLRGGGQEARRGGGGAPLEEGHREHQPLRQRSTQGSRRPSSTPPTRWIRRSARP